MTIENLILLKRIHPGRRCQRLRWPIAVPARLEARHGEALARAHARHE
jgi:hypothetical protein